MKALRSHECGQINESLIDQVGRNAAVTMVV